MARYRVARSRDVTFVEFHEVEAVSAEAAASLVGYGDLAPSREVRLSGPTRLLRAGHIVENPRRVDDAEGTLPVDDWDDLVRLSLETDGRF